ncbi:MAG: tetratricopeptide repeat protein [Dehalococcoidia bacterium]|nr:tetratricopeptide repeat protein [Dehalococcoidia bacterium]
MANETDALVVRVQGLKRQGDAHLQAGAYEEAVASYRGALEIASEYPAAENNLGIAYLALDRYDEAQQVFQGMFLRQRAVPQSRLAAFSPGFVPEGPLPPAFATTFKLADRIDQLAYLIQLGRVSPSFSCLIDLYRALLAQLESNPNRGPSTRLSEEQVRAFGGYYDKVIYYTDTPALAGPAINQALDFAALEQQFAVAPIVTIDDLLSEEALAGLRRFLLESTVFFTHSPANFVGSYMADGFSCSLIFQLAAELRQRLPHVLEDRPLSNIWAYRYDSRSDGVRAHFDEGSVTINFWITADSANQTMEGHGGLVMYDRESSPDWDWSVNVYKDDPEVQARMAAYLAEAKQVVAPYRCNRAVMFKSTLLHKSEPFQFRDGFEDRRMNITLLFRARED